uniref:Putative ovule protein n=1 Tax=Solanum chacoense TaxID=4108 RepID=A0A0V0HE02_SOLCH
MLQYSRKEQSKDCKRESLLLTVARFPSENFYSEHNLKSKGLIYSLVFFWKEHIKNCPSEQLFLTVLVSRLGKPLHKYLHMNPYVCYILYIHIYSTKGERW